LACAASAVAGAGWLIMMKPDTSMPSPRAYAMLTPAELDHSSPNTNPSLQPWPAAGSE
jgi:hypothetical protein